MGIPPGWSLAAAVVILAAVLESGWSTAAFIGLMLVVAAATSARRVARGISRGRWTAAPSPPAPCPCS